MKYIVIFCIAALAGCATPVTQTKLAVATHNDLLAAAAYATQNGYPARAAVWNGCRYAAHSLRECDSGFYPYEA